MSREELESFQVGLSAAEKDDLEKMIADFRRPSRSAPAEAAREPLQDQLDSLTQKLADLTEMLLNIDRQMAPLVEVIRLSHQKSELLNQRLDAVITALKKGHVL